MSKSIEELQGEIDDLQQTIDDHNDELSNREEEGYNKAMLEMEKKIEHAFFAGYKTITKSINDIKPWLNYKMEQRL
ncbi:MAG: hypothetical protein GY928_03155 [Colwellia sp.]|nr:hypothetical protein [Colwellia sp.]